ncbi:alpha-1,2-mannosyltransferase (Ktr4), putative [Talaromyces stipitatus ATCC 10500]|uniref:Alpha-1,2-mannosyltransferase (Ktr4), putative n=1 Tax=Talaromyces stipitatus (strain ATCC 10500 / CBS 375.48 / QM 6759 / NRRL 1006) TaxID=441959 RepID=B8MAR0_TALSN|nr:alpha-1,2-mannosyltransferase (Ktr4), putative [Talaromyces stipitatus ATCC 10500]EED17750.1 alpha-1,2-mannosyltransferase (Ktr4), putative [Talaromyces stipitatus ATCC 10500]
MAIARPIRLLGAVGILGVLLVLYKFSHSTTGGFTPVGTDKISDMKRDPLLDPTGEPEGILWRAEEHDYSPESENSARINATLLSLVRNQELTELVTTMKDLERTWNHKFNYPWTFLNDEPFTPEFKKRTQEVTKAKCYYEQVPKDHWEAPEWIDDELVKESNKILEENNIQYSDKPSYHKMCRWNSGMFYKHPALANTRYYWRVEPNVQFFCNVDYDVFRYMQDYNKTYGFTINLFDAPESLPTLWPETERFLAEHPEYISENNMMEWLVDDKLRPEHNKKANGYSTCHFWSNFEIGDMNFFRSEAYEAYFNHLDRAGGFFYERWGDAPVHSIALGLFEDASKVHWFRDIGYRHIPYFNCPNSPKCSGCTPGKFYEGASFLAKEDCRPNYFKYVGTH